MQLAHKTVPPFLALCALPTTVGQILTCVPDRARPESHQVVFVLPNHLTPLGKWVISWDSGC